MGSASSSADGCAGAGPDGSTRRLGATDHSSGAACPPSVSRPDRPEVLGRPKNWWTRGRRRSAETSSTSLPVSASTTARLAAVVLLPSPTPAETTITEVMSSWLASRAMWARRVR
jgi:hypothetical protein